MTRRRALVSALNLEEDEFAQGLAELLATHGVPTDAIALAFTKSALARDGAPVLEQLGRLRAMGVEIAIDDFGTGCSSLAYMQTIPASDALAGRLRSDQARGCVISSPARATPVALNLPRGN